MKTKLILVALLTTAFASAQNIFQDDFAAYFTGTDLNNQGTWSNNSSNPGGLGAAIGAIPNNADVLATPVSYPDYGSSINSIKISPDSDGCGTAFPAVTSGDLYVGFVLNLSNAQANNNSDFFRVLSGGNFNTTFRLYATPAPGAFFLGVSKGSNGNQINFTSNALGYNQDHLIIVKYTQGSGTNDDLISVYIDPAFAGGEPGTATITNNVGLDQAGNLDRLSFRQNWTNGMPTGNAGLLSLALTWADLGFSLGTEQFNSNTIAISGNEAKNGQLSITSNVAMDNASLKIIALNGAVIDSKIITIEATQNNININPLHTSGIYIVELTSQNGKRFTQKISVN
ncbi:T9SS type A sorting domain-containing protein [Flavobacterium sp.]|uniref:T9SS type A sorting domain-containing protein n=1 Tax=Flavobacterium sp. TaxID=239 RepID=UPI002612B72A|nr:T9SS type A sorting domain-containing protein [Flavobacterium sp.]